MVPPYRLSQGIILCGLLLMKTTATTTAPPSATPPSSNGFSPSMDEREPPAVVLDPVDVEAIDVVVLVTLVWLEVDVSADVVDLPVVVVVELLVVVEVEALLVVVAVELVLLVVVVEVVLVVVDDVEVLEVVVVVVDTLTKLPKTAIGVTPPGGYAL